MKSGPHLPQLEKALAQKWRPNTAINKQTNKQTNKPKVKKKRILYHHGIYCGGGVQVWFNIQNSICVIHNINRPKRKYHMIILIDEKNLTKI